MNATMMSSSKEIPHANSLVLCSWWGRGGSWALSRRIRSLHVLLLLLLGRLSSILFPPPQMLYTPPRQGILWTESSTPGIDRMTFSYCCCWHDVDIVVTYYIFVPKHQ